jgi:hypothetical protein
MGYFIYLYTKKAELELRNKRRFHYAPRQILKLFKRRIAIFELLQSDGGY